MRPIFWGIIIFVLSTVAWVFSIVINVLTLGHFKMLSNVLGVLFLASLPLALFGQLIRWFLKEK